MPIYTANGAGKDTTSLFKEMDLAHLAPSTATELHMKAFHDGNFRPQFDQYVKNMPDTLYATLNQKAVFTQKKFRKVLQEVPVTLVSCPVLEATFKGVNKETEKDLRGWGMERKMGDTNTWNGQPTFENVKEIHRLGPENTFTPGKCKTEGYLAYIMGMKGVMAFSAASTTALIEKFSTLINVEKIDENPLFSVPDAGHVDLPYCLTMSGKIPTSDEDIPMGSTSTDLLFLTHGYNILPLTANKGFDRVALSTKTGASFGGQVFPYFEGIQTPDKDFTYSVFSTLFYQSVGEDPSRAADVMGLYRRGFRSIAALSGGQILTHMYTGIKFALESQSCFKPVIEGGVYMGFVLLNDHLQVIQMNKVIPCLTAQELTTELLGLKQHDMALDSIIAVTKEIMVEMTPKYAYTVDDIDTPRKLNRVLTSIDKSDFTDDQWTKIEKGVLRTRYGQIYWDVNKDHLLTLLDYFMSGDESLMENAPMYFTESSIFTRNRMEKGLAAFGPRVPSLNQGGTKTITIPLSGLDNNLTPDSNGVRPIRYIPFVTNKAMNAAVADWTKLFSTGKFNWPEARHGRTEFVDRTKTSGIIDGADVGPVYEGIKANVKRVMGPGGNSGLKRGRAQEDEDREKVARRRLNKDVSDANRMADML